MLHDNLISSNIRILQEDLLKASFCERKDNIYIHYVFSAIGEYVNFDKGCFCTANVSKVLEYDLLKNFCYKQSDKMPVDYGKWNANDPYFMRLYSRQGKVTVRYDTYESYDEFLNSEIFKNFHKHYEIYHTLAIIFHVPNTTHYIFFGVHRSEPKNPFNAYDAHFIQAIFPYLFNTWAWRLGLYNCIPSEQKTVQLTSSELEIINLLAGEQTMFSSKELARTLSKSHKTVENQLNSIYRKLDIHGIDKKVQLVRISQSLLIQ